MLAQRTSCILQIIRLRSYRNLLGQVKSGYIYCFSRSSVDCVQLPNHSSIFKVNCVQYPCTTKNWTFGKKKCSWWYHVKKCPKSLSSLNAKPYGCWNELLNRCTVMFAIIVGRVIRMKIKPAPKCTWVLTYINFCKREDTILNRGSFC